MSKRLFQIAIFCGVICALRAEALKGSKVYEAARTGSVTALRQLIESGVDVNHRDAAGNSLLMHTAMYGGVDEVKFLLQKGADVNLANNAGATPLMRAAGNAEKIHLLVMNGANVNARSALGNSPLHTTARAFGSAKALSELVKAGAQVNTTNVFGATPLMAAAASGDLESVRLLVKHGADVNAHSRGSEANVIWGGGRSPLMWAAYRGDRAMAKFLISAGADVNSSEGFGSALSQAAWSDQSEMAEFLLKRGANVDLKDEVNGFTPLHWAAGTDRMDTRTVSVLVKNGANVNAEAGEAVDAFMGVPQTPLLIAKKRNDTPIAQLLRAAGATEPNGRIHHNAPLREIGPLTEDALRSALRLAIGPLEETATFSKGAYLRHSSKQDCVSCHQQYLPLTSFGFAKAAGIAATEKAELEVLEMVRRDNTNLHEITAQATFHPEPGHGYGYTLLSMASQNEPPSPEIDAMIHHLLVIQDNDGQWHNNLPRPPLQTSSFGPTALAIRALNIYGFPARDNEIRTRIARATHWLANAKPSNTEERAYQLLGLTWAEYDPKAIRRLAALLAKEQRKDGGWGQLVSLPSDAYATGLSLFALAQAGDTKTPVYQEGLAYLLRTQQSDGTWHVRTRAYPFQPTMRSGYPYSRDSWISASGASWAAMAIASSLQGSSGAALQLSAR